MRSQSQMTLAFCLEVFSGSGTGHGRGQAKHELEIQIIPREDGPLDCVSPRGRVRATQRRSSKLLPGGPCSLGLRTKLCTGQSDMKVDKKQPLINCLPNKSQSPPRARRGSSSEKPEESDPSDIWGTRQESQRNHSDSSFNQVSKGSHLSSSKSNTHQKKAYHSSRKQKTIPNIQ